MLLGLIVVPLLLIEFGAVRKWNRNVNSIVGRLSLSQQCVSLFSSYVSVYVGKIDFLESETYVDRVDYILFRVDIERLCSGQPKCLCERGIFTYIPEYQVYSHQVEHQSWTVNCLQGQVVVSFLLSKVSIILLLYVSCT